MSTKEARTAIAKSIDSRILSLAKTMVPVVKGATAAEMALADLRWPLGLGPLQGVEEAAERLASLVSGELDAGVDRTEKIVCLGRCLGLPALTDEATILGLAQQVLEAVITEQAPGQNPDVQPSAETPAPPGDMTAA